MKILHLVGGMVFVFLVSRGTVQPMLIRGASILTKGGSKKSLTSMFGNLSLKGASQKFSFQPKLKQSKKLFSKDYSKFSQFYRPNYQQRRWFSGTNGGAFDGVNPDVDLRMLKRCQLCALAEQLKCSEQEVQLRIEQQHEKLIREIIEQNPRDINAQDSNGNTPLILAIFFKNYAAFKVLLEMKADVNIPDFQGITALHYAVSGGDIRYVCALLEAGANPNVVHELHVGKEYFGQVVIKEVSVTSLFLAVLNNDFECLLELLAAGANPEFPTKEYKKLLVSIAKDRDFEDIANLLEIHPL